LIVASSGAEEWAEAAGYFDAFQEKYPDSVWHTDTVIATLPALAESGCQAEAADGLESLVLPSDAAGPTPEWDELFRHLRRLHHRPRDAAGGAVRTYSASIR
jgi:hypothetical protein